MDRTRLDGWKAIASYLKRSVRQCQRLQETQELPVHKFPGTRAVFAYEDELDSWLTGPTGHVASAAEVQLSRSGRHVTLPADLVGIRPSRQDGQEKPLPEDVSARRPSRLARLLPLVALGVLTLALLSLGIHHRHETGWRDLGTSLTGSWTFSGSGIVGRGENVSRFDTGHLVAPGTTATVTLSSSGTRWAGGLEIFEDDLHWTFVAISPREHEIVVQRFPTGSVETFFMGDSIEPAHPLKLQVAVGRSSLRVGCAGNEPERVAMDPWDVTRGRLVLRVGSPGDELHEPSGGTCTFKDLHVRRAPGHIPSDIAHEVPASRRPVGTYLLTVDNIDDQIDVLVDGRRLASAGYREQIGPLDIDSYLTRGKHTITALLFNRKWTASYGIRLTRNGTNIWKESRGSVLRAPYGCQALGQRLGMVKRLRFTFTAR